MKDDIKELMAHHAYLNKLNEHGVGSAAAGYLLCRVLTSAYEPAKACMEATRESLGEEDAATLDAYCRESLDSIREAIEGLRRQPMQ